MSWRTVIISTRCKLDYKMGYLVVRGEDVKRVFLDEIALLMIETTAVSMTAYLLAELVEKKIRVIFCDEKRNPVSELCPYYGSHDSARKTKLQASWPEQLKGSIWTAIIAEKVRNQSSLLLSTGHEAEAEKLTQYVSELEFADATNREGHAAKVYFNALFGLSFCRRTEDDPINAALNYGYNLLLSAFNREVSSNGYLTQLGLFHDNVFNPFNLSCDLMEPLRPLIDTWVASEQPVQLDTDAKHCLVSILYQAVQIADSSQTVLNAIKIYVKSVFDALNEGDASLICFPVL